MLKEASELLAAERFEEAEALTWKVMREQAWSRPLVGGDGFAVSNERVLTFGLGEAESIDSISVAWPAGTDEVFQ